MNNGTELHVPALKNLHEVLGESRYEDEVKEPCSFRLEPHRKEIAEGICQANGTTLSKFLRGCVSQLIVEYRG